jgi:hypothetical protein
MVECPLNFAAAKYPPVSDVAKLELREVGSKKYRMVPTPSVKVHDAGDENFNCLLQSLRAETGSARRFFRGGRVLSKPRRLPRKDRRSLRVMEGDPPETLVNLVLDHSQRSRAML